MLGKVLTAIVTPFTPDGSIDFDRFRSLARQLLATGSDGLVVCGTTGESPTLTNDEKVALWEAAVEEAAGSGTVIAGTGTYSTAESVQLTERAAEIGVDGYLIVTPYYSNPPPRGVIDHFRAIAAASDRPIILYNVPRRSVLNVDAAMLEDIAEIPNVVAVKETNHDLWQARQIVDLGLDLYAGDEHLVFPFLLVGAVGCICPHTHLVADRVQEMIRLYRDGDVAAAEKLDRELQPFYELMSIAVNPIAIKCALNLAGFEVGGLRAPLVEAKPDEEARVRDCLERLGLLAPGAIPEPDAA